MDCAGTDERPVGDARMWNDVAAQVDAPEFALPWLDRFYDADDVTVLGALGAAERPLSDVLAATDATATSQGPESGDERLVPGRPTLADIRRARRRGVVSLSDDESTVAAMPFWDRFELWSVFEGWKDVPAELRETFADGYLVRYTDSVTAALDDLAAGRAPREPTGNDCFILVSEAQAIVRDAKRVFVRPCACRRIYARCDKPVDVCLGIDEDVHDSGWEVSRERALEILTEADGAGLMFTANEPEVSAASWICCCCSDCCQPILAARRLGAEALWPQRRYRAVVDDEVCTACGTCVERCPFSALSFADAEGDSAPQLDGGGCRGCGVCASGCPADAIGMRLLTDSERAVPAQPPPLPTTR